MKDYFKLIARLPSRNIGHYVAIFSPSNVYPVIVYEPSMCPEADDILMYINRVLPVQYRMKPCVTVY